MTTACGLSHANTRMTTACGLSHANPLRSDRGFTLLEILIVMAILAFISMGIFTATGQTFKLREDLQTEGEFYNSIRIAMSIIDRDVTQMYSPLIMIQNGPQPAPSVTPATGNNNSRTGAGQTPGQGQLTSDAAADLQTDGTYWAPAIDNTGLRPSHFQGTDTKFTFISAAHIRMYKDRPESDFVKVAYETKKDEHPSTEFKLDDPEVLTKTENVDVFENDDFKDRKDGVVYPLLHGVSKVKIDYYNKRTEKWESSWDSEKVNNNYPDIIRMQIEVHGPSNLSFVGTYYFRPEMPLSGLNPSS
jgi:prepilin-type N-terminal cleavage/methylation domain-containing protein